MVLVISILAVVATLAAAFIFAARMETIKTANFKEGIKAGLVAEAGLAHAKRLLREDKESSNYDDNNDLWKTAFNGSSADVDKDGSAESKWIELKREKDGIAEVYGRYAIKVTDEASKININTAGFHNQNELKVTEGYSTFEVSLSKFISAAGFSSKADLVRDSILSYRYGTDNVPGSAGDDNLNNTYLSSDGIDNDADGYVDELSHDEGVDEPQEFVSYYPYGDDRPFFSVYDAKTAIGTDLFDDISSMMTAYSFDRNIDKDKRIRLDLNNAGALDIVNMLEGSGLSSAAQFAVNVVDYRDKDMESTVLFSGGSVYYGVEGIRINEIMVSPKYERDAIDRYNAGGPNGDWLLSGTLFKNSAPVAESEKLGHGGVWRFDNLRKGYYYLKVKGQPGYTVGDVEVSGVTHASMQHGDIFKETVFVGEDGKIDIHVYNCEIDKGSTYTTYFSGFELIEGPDAEYIELINITSEDVDLSGWKVTGLRYNDLEAQIPVGTVIKAFEYLVLAVDRDDSSLGGPVNLMGNNISFAGVWSGSPVPFSMDKVVQLEFSDAGLSRADDVIPDDPGVYDTVLMLKTSENSVVDRIEYLNDYKKNVSIERGDPAGVNDRDGDFLFDDWHDSLGLPYMLPLGTPTVQNNNVRINSSYSIGGAYTDVLVENGNLGNLGELFWIAAGDDWQRISIEDMILMSDKFTTLSYRLEAEEHFNSTESSGWQRKSRSDPLTDWFFSDAPNSVGLWEFSREDRFRDGLYQLSFYGSSDGGMSISLRTNSGWTDFTPAMMPDVNGSVRYGLVQIGGTEEDSLPSGTLDIKIKNTAPNGESYFDYLVLSPLNRVEGRVNINTASSAVLQSLPGINEVIAERIIAGRPYGETFGIGDILNGNILGTTDIQKKELFRMICNLITVKSDVYEILVRAQAIKNNQQTAEKRLRVVVER